MLHITSFLGGSTQSINGQMIIVRITRNDLNDIKRIEDLLVSSQTSYLSFSSELIRDMNNNQVVAIPTSNALPTEAFTNDTSGPQIVGFDLDMDVGILSIYFQETINIRSVNFSCFSILSDILGLNAHQLTGGVLLMPYRPEELTNNGISSGSGSGNGSGSGMNDTAVDNDNATNTFVPLIGSGGEFDQFVVLTDEVASRDTTAIFINITLMDLNTIKMLEIANMERTTFLRAESCAVRDQNNLPLIPVIPGQSVRFYTPDITSPMLQEFDLDMNNGRLTMRFSETVSGSRLMASQLTLQANSISNLNPDLSHSLILDTYVPGVDNTPGLSTEIVLTIKILDLNRIKQLTALAASRMNTYISISSSAIQDTTGNFVAAIPHTNALQVTNYTRDTTRPQLIGFTLDLNSDILSLTFDETVSGSTLDETQIIFQEYQFNTPGDGFYRLVGSPVHDDIESTLIQVNLSFVDRNAIKRIENVATRDRNTWIIFSENLINDTSMNQVIPILNTPSLDNPVQLFIPDSMSPQLLAFSLNLTSEVLSLSFSETVDSRTFDVTQIYLQSGPAADQNVTFHRLTTASVPQGGNSAFIDIQLSLQDLNTIKRFRNLATDENNTFIFFGSDLVQDMNSNSIINISSNNPQRVSVYFEDVTLPILGAFDLDLTREFLTLFFSETVDPSLLDLAGVTLQQNGSVDPDDMSSTNQSYELTGGSIVIANMFGPTLDIELTNIDLNNIKRLFNLATQRDDTFISFESSLIVDMNMNEVIPSPPLNAQQVRNYTRDSISPVLNDFSLNIDTGILRLSFSEVVNVNSFVLSMIYIQATPSDPRQSVRLLASEISPGNNTFIEVRLSRLDLDNIKRNIFIGISSATTNIAIPNPVLRDMAENTLIPIPTTNALGVGVFQADSQPLCWKHLMLTWTVDNSRCTLMKLWTL